MYIPFTNLYNLVSELITLKKQDEYFFVFRFSLEE